MTKRQKRGLMLVALGLSLVMAALGIHLAQEKRDALAGQSANVLLQQLQLSRTSLPAPDGMEQEETATAMPEKSYLGYSMIGTIRVPSLDIELPVLSTWSYELLDVAPCRYSGSLPTGDMILMGHNYKSHFTPLLQAAVGTEVEFEDVNGQVSRYTVAEITYLHKNDGEKLPSDYPLTLFTCTAGGQNRMVLRCQETKA